MEKTGNMRSPSHTLETIKARSAEWLRQGMSPRRLALTLAIGFAIGCFPLIGLPTALCALVALIFGLNQPAIQLANYAAMPLQMALVVPFVRLGGRLIAAVPAPAGKLEMLARVPKVLPGHAAAQLAMQAGGMAGKAVLAWTLVAVPVVALLTPVLTIVLRRVPALAESVEEELI